MAQKPAVAIIHYHLRPGGVTRVIERALESLNNQVDVLVLTGEGKGKTTAALGLGLRAYGHGLRVCVIQFIKERANTGEVKAAEALGDGFEVLPAGAGFVRQQGGTPEDRERAAGALELARGKMTVCDVLVLDEINGAVKIGLIPVENVLALIHDRPGELHLVLTGRDAAQSVIDAADTVTDMAAVKHDFDAGGEAGLGIEF
jgi:cob(I)alamin adenosyltransferase